MVLRQKLTLGKFLILGKIIPLRRSGKPSESDLLRRDALLVVVLLEVVGVEADPSDAPRGGNTVLIRGQASTGALSAHHLDRPVASVMVKITALTIRKSASATWVEGYGHVDSKCPDVATRRAVLVTQGVGQEVDEE